MTERLIFTRPARSESLAQAAIALLSPIAIGLLMFPALAGWGCVVGLISQPFWIYSTARARQAGMFAISVLYLAIWILGIWNHFPGLLP